MKGWRECYDAQRFPAPRLTELGGSRFTPTNAGKPKYDFSKPEDVQRFVDDEMNKLLSSFRAWEVLFIPNPVTGTGMYHDWMWEGDDGKYYIWDKTQKPPKPFPLPKEDW